MTLSPFFNFITLTPAAVRPISLTSLSLNLIDCPLEVTTMHESPLFIPETEINLSPSESLIAMIPLVLTSWKLAAETFLPVPSSVTIISEKSFSSFKFLGPPASRCEALRAGIGKIDVTFSPSEREMKFIIDFPRVALRPSGNSYIFI